jgi:hypothetical protein
MTSAFILTLDHGSDTDLLGIADDVKSSIEKDGQFIVIDVKPYAAPVSDPYTLAAPSVLPTPPVVTGQ